MQYENHTPPEEINYSSESPLKEFVWLLVTVAALIVTTVTVLHLCATFLAPFIPFKYEEKIAQPFVEQLASPESESTESEHLSRKAAVQTKLQELADEIAPLADLPEGMQITVHFSDSDTMNAFATLGGNIVIFQGLLERIESENALVMLMAHEMAHIKHRDPIVSLGRGVVSSIAVSLISSSSQNTALSNYLGTTGLLTQLSFNRSQEESADELALKVVQARFGHTHGAEQLFEEIQSYLNDELDIEPPEFFNSHPNTDDRIERILATQNDSTHQLVELPEVIRDYIDSASE